MEELAEHQEFDENDEDNLERDALGRIRREYFPRIHPFQRYRERKFQFRYRLSRNLAAALADDFGHSPFATSGRSLGGGLSHRDRFCLALRYYATGSFYGAIGDTQGVHKSTVCRAVRDVTNYLYSRKEEFIHFPQREEYHLYAIDYAKHDFPCVIGSVDGTYVNIIAPKEFERTFVNRKWNHSLNVMCVSDPFLRFSYVDARFPGSSHDSYVFRRSSVGLRGDRRIFHGYWFLGDSAYALKPYLLTPILAPVTDADLRYNESHRKTRVTVERAFGVMKQRFRCCDSTSGVILAEPQRAAKIVMACAILHNICVHHNLPIRIDNDWDARQRPRPRRARVPPQIFEPAPGDLENEDPPGVIVRRRLIDTVFINEM